MTTRGLEGASRGLGIGVLSKRTGCNIETIRYYERIGLLPKPPRAPSGYRMYKLDDVNRLRFIRRARSLGFTLDAVRGLLKLSDDETCNEVSLITKRHLKEIAEKIANLRAMQRVLSDLVVHCDAGGTPGCPLIEALSRESL
ncbi:MAG: MerR family transcriptional regulator [Gammaproteobacteria bacterium]